VSKRSGLYPHVRVDTASVPAVAHTGGALLTRTARVSGLDVALSRALGPWRKPLARHDPAKVLRDCCTWRCPWRWVECLSRRGVVAGRTGPVRAGRLGRLLHVKKTAPWADLFTTV